jgi:hypothetical protein
MTTWNARAAAAEVLASLVDRDTSLEDSHPSLRERLDRLGEIVRLPPPIARSSGQELLGDTLEAVATRFDEIWLSHHAEEWRQQRVKYLEQRTSLNRLTAIEQPTREDLFARAELIEALEGADEALPVYQAASGQGHPAASLAAGRLLLARMNPQGVALVEQSMDRDESLVPEGCRVLADYYRETSQELNARKCEWRATRHATRAHLRWNLLSA